MSDLHKCTIQDVPYFTTYIGLSNYNKAICKEKKKRKEKWNCIVPIFDVKGVEKKTIGTSPLL